MARDSKLVQLWALYKERGLELEDAIRERERAVRERSDAIVEADHMRRYALGAGETVVKMRALLRRWSATAAVPGALTSLRRETDALLD